MDREALLGWIGEGLSLDEIGRRVGRHPSTVAYWLRKHGLSAAHAARHTARGEIAPETLELLLERGLTTREIASELGRSQTNVRYWMQRHSLVVKWGVPADAEPAADGTALGTCRRHGEARFARRSDGAWRCLRCRAAAVTERRRRVKALLVAEAGGSCALCGYSRSIAALEFHHVDPREKSFDVGRVGVTLSLARARSEARKCVLLCSNCHVEVEMGVSSLPS